MGYTLRALGAALWAVRRSCQLLIDVRTLDDYQSDAGNPTDRPCTLADRFTPGVRASVFKIVLTEMTLQGGDADTNGAVVGSLLGALFGYSGLPNQWCITMWQPGVDYLSNRVTNLLGALGQTANDATACTLSENQLKIVSEILEKSAKNDPVYVCIFILLT